MDGTMKTLVRPWGNSQGIRISKELLNLLGIAVNEEVKVLLFRPYGKSAMHWK